jgi:hypothetical protein
VTIRRSIESLRLIRRFLFGIGLATFGAFLPEDIFAQGGSLPSVLLANTRLDSVWRVGVDGTIESALEVPMGHLQSNRTAEGYWEADGSLTPSKDQKRIAFRARGDIWLFDVVTKQKRQITNVGMPSDKIFATVSASPVIWSWDSARLIYSVRPGDRDGPGYAAVLQERAADYGDFVLDVATGVSRRIPNLSGYGAAWLSDDRLLIWTPAGLSVREVHVSSTASVPVLKFGGPQIYVGADGKRLIASLTEISRSSQIVELEIADGDWRIVPVSPKGAFAEYQWPALSPSGQKRSYLRMIDRIPVKPGSRAFHPAHQLIADGKPVYTFIGRAKHSWITDRVLALLVQELQTSTEAIVVVDTESGREIARHVVQKHGGGAK